MINSHPMYMYTHAYMYTVHMGWSAGQALIIAKGHLSPVTQGYSKLSTTCTCTHSDYVEGRGCVCGGEGGGGGEAKEEGPKVLYHRLGLISVCTHHSGW